MRCGRANAGVLHAARSMAHLARWPAHGYVCTQSACCAAWQIVDVACRTRASFRVALHALHAATPHVACCLLCAGWCIVAWTRSVDGLRRVIRRRRRSIHDRRRPDSANKQTSKRVSAPATRLPRIKSAGLYKTGTQRAFHAVPLRPFPLSPLPLSPLPLSPLPLSRAPTEPSPT